MPPIAGLEHPIANCYCVPMGLLMLHRQRAPLRTGLLINLKATFSKA